MDDPAPPTSRTYDLLVDALFLLAVGVNLYVFADIASEGQLSRSIANKVIVWWGVQRDRAAVFAHARDITETAAEPHNER